MAICQLDHEITFSNLTDCFLYKGLFIITQCDNLLSQHNKIYFYLILNEEPMALLTAEKR